MLIDSMEYIASFDIDAQKCFSPLCPNELPVPGGNEIVRELNRQAALAGLRIGSKDAHPRGAVWEATDQSPQMTPVSGHVNADYHWNRHGVPGTVGFELLEGLPDVMEYDYFVWKGVEPTVHPYGACYHDLTEMRSTGVIEFLCSRGIRTVIVGGLALDFCVKTTVLQLLSAGFGVVVNLGACRSLDSISHRSAVDIMKCAGAQFVDSVSGIQQIKNNEVDKNDDICTVSGLRG